MQIWSAFLFIIIVNGRFLLRFEIKRCEEKRLRVWNQFSLLYVISETFEKNMGLHWRTFLQKFLFVFFSNFG